MLGYREWLCRVFVLLGCWGAAAVAARCPAQDTRPVDGLRSHAPAVYALTDARLVVSPGRTIEKGTLVIRDGVIAAAGADIAVPADAQIRPAAGKTIYAGLIDAYSETTVNLPEGGAPYWNLLVTPQLRVADLYKPDASLDERFRGQGIVARLVAPSLGIIKGESAVVATGAESGDRVVLRSAAALHLRLGISCGGRGSGFPSSPMGAVALARQTFLDAGWYAQAWAAHQAHSNLPRPERNDALAVLQNYLDGRKLLVIDTANELYLLRADAFAREFSLHAAIRGSGQEYQRLDAVRATGRTVIVPMNFPQPPDVSTPELARNVETSELMHWDIAPENPARLDAAGVRIALTAHGLRDVSEFLNALRTTIERGLAPDSALRAVTVAPAQLLGVDDRLGTLESGKAASFFVTDGDLFDKKTKILETWVDGRRYDIEKKSSVDPRGEWKIVFDSPTGSGDNYTLKLTGTPAQLQGTIEVAAAGKKTEAVKLTRITLRDVQLSAVFESKVFQREGVSQFSAVMIVPREGTATMSGSVAWPDGTRVRFSATRTALASAAKSPDESRTQGRPPNDAKDKPSETVTSDEKPAAGERARAAAEKTSPPKKKKKTKKGRPKPQSSEIPAKPDETKPDETKPDELKPDESKPDETKPDETKPNETKPDESKPDATKPDEKNAGAKKTGEKDAHEKSLANEPSAARPADEPGKKSAGESEPKKPDKVDRSASFPVNFPLGAAGRKQAPPQPRQLLLKNATIWTCGPQGILENASLLIGEGRILAVGQQVAAAADAQVIDLAGKHISPGIIDCHSHMATDGGINEGTQAITAEVRIADFIDCDDIDIYRQLAGGVTAANILHGSANPIGGQNQVIKLRWGELFDAMRFAEAPPGIKFALGENVKQSNWGSEATNRYPQSRMGVEQIIRDAFEAARRYTQQQRRWESKHDTLPPRRDLELDALVEVLAGTRLVHCHSYRQDEILALLRTCEEFQIRIATLQHILEGYKIADVMARHGAMGSAFSDWWAYKVEVYDAIPYAGALMHQAGVVVSFNSDDKELARHLNHEAAKAMKYGNVPAEEALKFVTMNPARQLRIDQYVGSLEKGKHADFVVWSGSPLSIVSRCEQTWIDGRNYFSLEEDQRQRDESGKVRSTLIQKVLASGQSSRSAEENKTPDEDLWPREDIYCRMRQQ